MKRFGLLLLAIVICSAIQGQTANNSKEPSRPKVGVVLGGGGAKGASHIGVLKYIEEIGIPVDFVAGTSMGSILGGMYAMGYSPDEMTRLISNINWSEYIGNKIDRRYLSKDMRERRSTTLANIPFGSGELHNQPVKETLISQLPSAYVNNSSLINLFNDLCVDYQDDMDFNDMPIPFACVATDLITGQEVVLHEGSMPTALRASMAIPGVFAPVKWGDYLLVDGGLVNNFPADVLRDMGADIIIGVEVTNENKVSAINLKSLPQVMGRILINGTSAKRKENRQLCDVRIVPDISGFGMLSFTADAIDTLVGRGYRKAAEYHDQLIAIKQHIEEKAGGPVKKELHAPQALNLLEESVFVNSLSINGVTDRQSRWLIRKGGLKAGRYYSKDDIEEAINIYRGTGCFDEITYTLKACDTVGLDNGHVKAYSLNINVMPASPHIMGLGLRYDTEDGAALLLSLNLNEKKFGSSKLGFEAKLSYNPRINLKYTYSRSSLANFNLTAGYRNEHFRSRFFWDKYINLHYWQFKGSAFVSEFHLLNFSTSVGLSYIYTVYDKTSFNEASFDDYYLLDNAMLAPFVMFRYDNLDDPHFAKHGVLSNVNSHFYYMPSTKEKFFDICYAFQSYISPCDGRFTIIPQVYGRYVNTDSYYNLANTFGGEIAGRHFENQMPFIGLTSTENAYSSTNSSILRCDLRYNFYGNHYLTTMYNISVPWGMLGTGGMIFVDIFNFCSHGAGLKYSYDSFIGPISLTAHWFKYNERNYFGGYFSFGYTF